MLTKEYDSQVIIRKSRDEYISPEEALKLIEEAKRDTLSRLYLPSGKMFLNVIDEQWVFALFGDYTNTPMAEMKPGVVWRPAEGTYRMGYNDIFSMAIYLWNFLSGNLEKNEKILNAKSPKNIKSNRIMLCQYSPEREQIFIRFIDYSRKQSTIFPLTQHHALELYLGIMAGFRVIAKRHFESQSDAASKAGISPMPITMIEAHPLDNVPLEVILRPTKIVIRDIRTQDNLKSLHAAQSSMLSHVLTSYLTRNLNRVVKFGDRITIALPFSVKEMDDKGKIIIGEYKSDFSKKNTAFNVAIHMASYYLIDGLPTMLIR